MATRNYQEGYSEGLKAGLNIDKRKHDAYLASQKDTPLFRHLKSLYEKTPTPTTKEIIKDD